MQSTHWLADIMGNMQSNRQTTMNQEPTAKRSWKDQDTTSAAVDGLTNGMAQSAEDQHCATAELQAQPVGEIGPTNAPYTHRVEYPQALHVGPGHLYTAENGSQMVSYYPHIDSAWTYPYAWSHGTATRDYGTEYHVANTLAQMAGVRRHHVGDPISSTTMPPSTDPGSQLTMSRDCHPRWYTGSKTPRGHLLT